MFRILVLILVATVVGGCSSISGIPERSVDVKTELKALKPYFDPGVINTYDSKSTDSEKKAYRNEVLSARIRAIDLNFNEFIKNLSTENKDLNIGTDSATLVLGAAGAVSTVSSTQAIISATSATVTGAKSSIDKNAYYDSTLVALVSQMQANRQTQLVAIYSGMDKGVDAYPLMRALVDIENYFQAGTIIGAVNEINKQAGEIKTEADKEISEILKSPYKKDEAGDMIKKFIKTDGKTVNSANEEKVKSWMKAHGLGGVSLTYFMYSEEFSAQREQAVKDISIK